MELLKCKKGHEQPAPPTPVAKLFGFIYTVCPVCNDLVLIPAAKAKS
jgi:hypothetical protein